MHPSNAFKKKPLKVMKYQHLFPRSNCIGYCRILRMQKNALCGSSGEKQLLFTWNLWRDCQEGEALHEFEMLQGALNWAHYFETI